MERPPHRLQTCHRFFPELMRYKQTALKVIMKCCSAMHFILLLCLTAVKIIIEMLL